MDKVTSAVLCALTTHTVFPSLAAQEDKEEDESKIPVILVTASKRLQSTQDSPIAVQAISMEELKQQNIGNFDEFVRYVPNVAIGGRGPGQSDIFIRGMAVQPIAVMLSGAQGTMPNVALYIDEQPVTAPGRNLDVYAVDLERIEVLPGPQGTLFGASSQAGTIRYITRKPNLYDFEAGISTTISSTYRGGNNNSVEGYINIPVNEKFAIRTAFYNTRHSGYIDNVQGEYSLDPSINPNVAESIRILPANTIYQSINNTSLIKEDFNDSYYSGYRLSASYLFDNDWELLVQQAQQELGADGVFDYDPEIGDLEVSRFFPDYLRDEFDQTSWTLKGRMLTLEIVYAGAFLDREVNQSIDYTGYNNSGAFIPWYTCTYDAVRECLDPTKGFIGQQFHERFTQELRFSTDPEKEWRATAGIFVDDFTIKTLDNYLYLAAPALGFVPNAPLSSANSINPDARAESVTFFNDITRSENQWALFGEIEYDINDDYFLILGLRKYSIESDFTGSSNFAEKNIDGDAGRDYDLSGGHSNTPLKIDDVIPKLSLGYKASEDQLYYLTYSQGFRPGGFNRGGGIESANPEFPDVAVTYQTDNVVNYELGWKTDWLERELRFNGCFYLIKWSDMQVSRFDPVNVSILTFIENAADSEITGLEGDLTWATTENLTLYGSFSINDTKLVNLNAQAIELAELGSELPMTPKSQGNLRARYEWELGKYQASWQIGWQLASSSWSSIVAEEREKQESYSLINLSFTMEKEDWQMKLFVDNLADKRAQLFINTQDDIRRITTNRPRTIGLMLSYYY
nr:TonB-dependent receptor [Aliikangiella sp. G2MR2-5]